MPFAKEFIHNASKLVEVKSVEADLEIVKQLVTKALRNIAKINRAIKTTAVDIYIHGSYANATNVYFPSNLEVCVELKITTPFEYKLTNEYYVTHDLDTTPKMFRDLLYDALQEITQPNCSKNNKCIVLQKFGKLRHMVEITPCVSFRYIEEDHPHIDGKGSSFAGVLLRDAGVNADIATFPKLHAKNGQTKDIRCSGNFKRMVRMFKTLNAIHTREVGTESARGYFIECLLFNIPDQMYRGSDLDEIFLKVINYLTHADLGDSVCQNLVWHLFGNTPEFWDEDSAHRFIKMIKTMYTEFPANRTTLA